MTPSAELRAFLDKHDSDGRVSELLARLPETLADPIVSMDGDTVVAWARKRAVFAQIEWPCDGDGWETFVRVYAGHGLDLPPHYVAGPGAEGGYWGDDVLDLGCPFFLAALVAAGGRE